MHVPLRLRASLLEQLAELMDALENDLVAIQEARVHDDPAAAPRTEFDRRADHRSGIVGVASECDRVETVEDDAPLGDQHLFRVTLIGDHERRRGEPVRECAGRRRHRRLHAHRSRRLVENREYGRECGLELIPTGKLDPNAGARPKRAPVGLGGLPSKDERRHIEEVEDPVAVPHVLAVRDVHRDGGTAARRPEVDRGDRRPPRATPVGSVDLLRQSISRQSTEDGELIELLLDRKRCVLRLHRETPRAAAQIVAADRGLQRALTRLDVRLLSRESLRRRERLSPRDLIEALHPRLRVRLERARVAEHHLRLSQSLRRRLRFTRHRLERLLRDDDRLLRGAKGRRFDRRQSVPLGDLRPRLDPHRDSTVRRGAHGPTLVFRYFQSSRHSQPGRERCTLRGLEGHADVGDHLRRDRDAPDGWRGRRRNYGRRGGRTTAARGAHEQRERGHESERGDRSEHLLPLFGFGDRRNESDPPRRRRVENGMGVLGFQLEVVETSVRERALRLDDLRHVGDSESQA